MKAKKVSKHLLVKREEDYIKFLKKRLEGKNYKANSSDIEYEVTAAKYSKAKLKLRSLKGEF